jgi:hypothetical protein
MGKGKSPLHENGNTGGAALDSTHPQHWLAHMNGSERRRLGDEQLVTLLTLLLEGYLPVAYIVADLDDEEALGTIASEDARRNASYAFAHRERMKAA